jgi:hypothetical protein
MTAAVVESVCTWKPRLPASIMGTHWMRGAFREYVVLAMGCLEGVWLGFEGDGR